MTEESKEYFKGTVKWFNDAKGFGFIQHVDGKDVFVHYSSIEDDGFKTLKDGEEVQYQMEEGPKGFHAIRVTRPNKPAEELTTKGKHRKARSVSKEEVVSDLASKIEKEQIPDAKEEDPFSFLEQRGKEQQNKDVR